MKWLASENGKVHVCGHRGDSVAAPENTLAAFKTTVANGGTSAEIDIVLSQDGEIFVSHDLSLDRTTNGSGLVAAMSSNQLQQLDAGSWFDARFSGEPLATLKSVLIWAKGKLGLVIEIKERQRVPELLQRLKTLLAETQTLNDVMVISFDYHVLVEAKRQIPGVKTEGITHVRHVNAPAIAQAAQLDSLSIELAMFHPDDARALHAAGVAIRCHLPRPERIAQLESWGFEITESLAEWLPQGLIDSLSGDDVSYLRKLVERYPLEIHH